MHLFSAHLHGAAVRVGSSAQKQLNDSVMTILGRDDQRGVSILDKSVNE